MRIARSANDGRVVKYGPIHSLRIALPHKPFTRLLEPRIVPDISKVTRVDETLHYARHVYVYEWATLPVLEHQDCVRNILADSRHL